MLLESSFVMGRGRKVRYGSSQLAKCPTRNGQYAFFKQ